MTDPTDTQTAATSPAIAAIAGIRETAKWAVAALAALAAAIAAGSQLSSIGSIQDPLRLAGAILAAVIGLLAVAAGIWLTVDVLLPRSLSLRDLEKAELQPQRDLGLFLATNRDLIQGQAASVAELARRYREIIAERDQKYVLAQLPTATNAQRAAANAADDEAVYLSSVVSNLIVLASFERLRLRFGRWRIALTAAVICAGVAMVAFAWAANPPKDVGETVSLRGANLTGDSLVGADLSGVDLSGADLSGSNLRGAKLTGAILDNVNWSNATCPNGRSSKDEGGSCRP